MSLQRLPWPVSCLERSGTNGKKISNVRTAHFLVGFAEELFPFCFQRLEEVRHVRRFRYTCVLVARHHDPLRRCSHSRSLSSSPFSPCISTPYRTMESTVTIRPWETRVTEGNDGVQTEKGVQRQRLANGFSERSEIQKAWGLRWENDSVQSNLDDERAAGLRIKNGGEKTSGLVTTNCEQPQYKEQDYETEDEVQQDDRVRDFAHVRTGRSAARNLEREMEMALRAVQLACSLSQRTQRRVLQKEEKVDEKKDRSLVTVADWGVQAVVSWVLAQGLEGEAIPMIAEEDTTGLRGMEKIDLLHRVVEAVNLCLQEAGVVGICPPAQPLGAMDVLKAIGKGSAEGGKKGRYWVLDPVDGTLGFVRGDQYAIALGLIEDGEVVLAVLGCPNFPLRKEWLRYHHRYYRIASKLRPPSPGKWHKGLVLTTTKGSGQVMMQPLMVNADGSPQLHLEASRPVRVSSIDDPAKATFCEPFEKANSSHSFTAGLAQSLGLRWESSRILKEADKVQFQIVDEWVYGCRNRPLRVYSLAKYAAIARGDAEIFMKFARAGYKEKIWDHAAGFLIVQEAGGVVTDAAGKPLDFSQGRLLKGLDRGIIACSGTTLLEKLLKAVDASWDSSTL